MKKILITGGTGLVGKNLTSQLTSLGYEVVLLSRNAGESNGVKRFKWDIKNSYIDLKAFEGVNHLIHLAGAGIADKRWTAAYKKEILESRIQSTKLLVDTIREHNIQLESFASTSAIGVYGNSIQGEADEDYPAATNYLANVCVHWEAEATKMTTLGIRTSIIRVGVVLAKESGFIPEVAKPIRYFIGAALADGKQLLSWIHVEDLCRIYVKTIEDLSMNGVYNAVTPTPVSNQEITQKMARLLHRYIVLPPIPLFVLRLLFGDVAGTLIANQYVVPKRLEQQHFNWLYPKIDDALSNLIVPHTIS